MRVIPVVDLKGGLVVRGVAGRRAEYRPVESVLASDPRPQTVAQAFAGAGFREAYVADLDAIGGVPPARETYSQLAACGLSLIVDAGLSSVEQAHALAGYLDSLGAAHAIVAGLESLPDPATLAAMVRAVGPRRLVFSLDMKSGRPLNTAPAWRELSPRQIAVTALRAGVRRLIVLDLAAVGVNQGVGTQPLCRQLRCLDATLEIIAGGGVRGPQDLESLAAAGCDAALVASALHDGRIAASRSY
jgi:phosphoribosylformimino-5-aminoimidazole carboxamide ribotide isomerase